ncbi:hypothetical protein vseg_020015 [Gypsophila vaccaria]
MTTMINHNNILDAQEQICYVQCNFCTTMLLVSVPYSSMTMVVTVRCGHCTSLLSVNMLKASFLPFHLFSSLNHDQLKRQEEVDTSKTMDRHNRALSIVPSEEEDNDINDDEEEEDISTEQIVNKPPEKKKRAPSAYNRFIKEEIKRLKARNPTMSHKEAFSTAAKNWAHCPTVQNDEIDDEEEENSNDEKENAQQKLD